MLVFVALAQIDGIHAPRLASVILNAVMNLFPMMNTCHMPVRGEPEQRKDASFDAK